MGGLVALAFGIGVLATEKGTSPTVWSSALENTANLVTAVGLPGLILTLLWAERQRRREAAERLWQLLAAPEATTQWHQLPAMRDFTREAPPTAQEIAEALRAYTLFAQAAVLVLRHGVMPLAEYAWWWGWPTLTVFMKLRPWIQWERWPGDGTSPHPTFGATLEDLCAQIVELPDDARGFRWAQPEPRLRRLAAYAQSNVADAEWQAEAQATWCTAASPVGTGVTAGATSAAPVTPQRRPNDPAMPYSLPSRDDDDSGAAHVVHVHYL